MGPPDVYVSTALLFIACILVGLIIVVLAAPNMVHADTEALIALTLSLLLIAVLIAAARWG